jgi:Putative Ig domain/Bacterial Ig domain
VYLACNALERRCADPRRVPCIDFRQVWLSCPGEQPLPERTDRTEIQDPDQPQEEALLGEQVTPREWLAPLHSAHAPVQTLELATVQSVPRGVSGAMANEDFSAPALQSSQGMALPPLAPYSGPPDDGTGRVDSNQAPVVVVGLSAAAVAEDGSFSYDASTSFADVDSIHGDTLTFSATLSGGVPLPAWLAIDPATGVLCGTPLNASVGLLTVDVTATDGGGASATSSFQLTVSNANDVPVLAAPIGAAAGPEDLAFSYDVSASFADDDTIHGDTLSYSASLSGGAPLPTWLAIDAATGVLSGTPLNADVGLLTVDVTATDGAGASATASFQLTVSNTNDVPVVVTPIAATVGPEDLAFSYDVSTSFAADDAIHGDSLTYSASLSGGAPLPGWLAIDPATGVLSGTPLNAHVGLLTVDVTATDGAGASATASFQLTVSNTNDAPVVLTPIPDVSANLLSLFTYDTSTSFADADLIHGDSLTYSAQLSGLLPLPGWLSIDPATGVLSGIPGLLDLLLPVMVEVTATDAAGASATTTFQVSTNAINDAPVLNDTPSPTLTSIVANSADPAGSTVAEIMVDGSITDPDGATVEAMAVTGVDDSNGTWEYSIDGGAIWNAVGAVSDNAALLLDASGRLRFVPDPGFAGSAAFTFRAWDMTSGASGDTGVDVSTNGGTTAYSAQADAATIAVLTGSPDLSTGAEFQANSASAKEQESPAVTALADGGFVTVWQSKDQDGDNWGVYGQRYDAAGNAVGAEFQVNTYATNEQQSPSVAALADGGFVVAWQSKDQDGDNWGVYGQRYDAAGNAVGAEFQINTYSTVEQQSPSVAALADGGFVVTWQSKSQDGDNWGIYGRRYDAAGNAIGAEFQVNSTTAKEQQSPSLATLADGGFVVTWQSKDQDGDNWGVYGQRYDPAGTAVGAEFRVNTTTAQEQQNPSVAALADGGFVVTWQSWDQDGHEWGVYGQRFDAAGNPVDLEFQVNTEFSTHQQDPTVVGFAGGGFLVTWQSKDQDGDDWGVFGQKFDADGDAIGTEFQIHTTAAGAQTDPALAASGEGALLGAWTSPDADLTGVSGHLYQSETASVTVNPPSVAASSMLDFGGTNSYVDAGDPGLSANALDPGTRDFTAEAWFYYAGPGGTQTILSKGNTTELDAGFSIFLSGSELVVRVTTEFGVDAAASSVTMPGAQGWYHVAMVIDQEAGVGASQVTGYLNGSSAGWTPGYGAVPGDTFSTLSGGIDTTDSFMIGAVDSGGTVSGYFGAQIADVRIWNTARSLSEIQADLGRSLNGDEDHLIANWKLDEGLGGTAQDAATGGHDGTINGGPAWQPSGSLSVVQDGTLTGRISATDPEGDTLTYSVGTGPSNGIAAIDPQTGTWPYNPNAGYTGTDSVSYQVSDGNGGSDTINVAITVTP